MKSSTTIAQVGWTIVSVHPIVCIAIIKKDTTQMKHLAVKMEIYLNDIWVEGNVGYQLT